jgi:16S rRNA (guanine527-N7)-methyltransferase
MRQVDELRAGIEEMGLDIDTKQQELLLKYVALLHKWNKVYNLTAIRDPQKMVSHHLLDSLAVLPYLWPGSWLDVGCGAGVPGLILAVARPQWQFILLDSNSKKTGFVQQAIIELNLKNVGVFCSRVEDYKATKLFDGIISRAFADLGEFLKITRHLMAERGCWVAMKGWAEKELEGVPEGCRVEKVIPLQVPKIDAVRSLIVVSCNGVRQHG